MNISAVICAHLERGYSFHAGISCSLLIEPWNVSEESSIACVPTPYLSFYLSGAVETILPAPLPSLIYPSDSFILTPLESSSLTVPASYKYCSVIFKGQLIILPSGQPYFMAGSRKKLCNPVLLLNFQRNIFLPFLPVPAQQSVSWMKDQPFSL